MKVTYFVNQYPKVSHSFIRREILALERQGVEIQRIALRGWQEPLPDPLDQAERSRTHYLLRAGLRSLLFAALTSMIRSPLRMLRGVRAALRAARTSDRPLPYHLIYLCEAILLARTASAFGARHIHAHFGTNSAETAMLAHIVSGMTFSFTVHGPEEFSRNLPLSLPIAHACFTAAISSYTRSQLFLRSRPTDWEKIHVIGCGLEASYFSHPCTTPTGSTLVCVGRLCDEKGQLLLLQAASELVRRGREFKLVLAGDGPTRSTLEAYISAHELAQHVQVTGWISSEQVKEHILSARALVLPSFAEGLPVVIMEAMALYRPVISTYIAGIPELVVNGETGWLVPASSLEHLTNAIDECLSVSPQRLAEMGRKGHELARRTHTADTEAEKLVRLFRAPTLHQ